MSAVRPYVRAYVRPQKVSSISLISVKYGKYRGT